MQEELVSLAQQANTNVKYLLEAEKHVFTNSGGYMTKVNDMKRYLQKKREPQAFVPPRHRGMPVLQERSWAEDSVKDSEDEVSRAAFIVLLSSNCQTAYLYVEQACI